MSWPGVDLSGRRVLVTGGTGFIGGRLVERLVLECGAEVCVLVRTLGHVARIARFPVDLSEGDITDAGAVRRAAEGCDIIFHCAYGNTGSDEERAAVNVRGTENILVAAKQVGARVVHVSTVAAYGPTEDGDLDETTPRQYSGMLYADTKLDAEKLVRDYVAEHDLAASIIQPTVVYGPFAPVWTEQVIQQLKTHRVVLIDGGAGLCNAVYVDDVVSALLLAGVKDEALGETLLISADQPVTWRDFYGRFERMLDLNGSVSMSAQDARERWDRRNSRGRPWLAGELVHVLLQEPAVRRRLRRTRELTLARKTVRALLPSVLKRAIRERLSGNGRRETGVDSDTDEGRAIQLWSPPMIDFYAAKTRVRIDKARRLLDYDPAFDFEAGMELTERWARWANLL